MSTMTEPTPQPGPETIEVQTIWPENLGAEAQVVNQAVFTWDQDSRDVVYMLLGHVAPPVWLSQETAQQRIAELGNAIPVQPRGSFLMSRKRAEDIWRALGKHLGKLTAEGKLTDE
jgi:hypothetical protein